MIIPPFIKRRVVEIDNYLTQNLLDYPYYLVSQHKEEYLFSISRDLSGWFIQTYYCRSEVFHTEYYKKVNEIIPFIKYLIRTKIILHWEKMNEVKHPELS
jgi:hypothetical protein